MEKDIKFDIKYDYSTALVLEGEIETLIGGSEKIVEKALKNSKNPNLDVKGLDVYYRGKPLGTFAIDANTNAPRAEVVTDLTDILYTNLLNLNSTAKRISETKMSLETLFRTDGSFAVRLLARTILSWYDTVTDIYMNGRKSGIMRVGLPLNQKNRAALGEQFRDDVNALTETLFTRMKKNKSPRGDAETGGVIRFNCADIGEFLDEYSRYLYVKKVYCIHCKLCGKYFTANSWNTRYCVDCKMLRKQNSKKIYAEKSSEGVHKERQTVKFRFENFIHKCKLWETLSESEKAEYNTLRKEFVTKSAAMLRDYERDSSVEQESEIMSYIDKMNSERVNMECKFENGNG